MGRQSAGLLIYRRRAGSLGFFLVHPGGPYWTNRDLGSWSIPKGEFAEGEDPLSVARREFQEETGQSVSGEFIPLPAVKQRGGKTVHPWLVAADFDASTITSNTFSMEWPPRSGNRQEFPEVDRAEWFTADVANQKIIDGQRPLLAEAESLLDKKP